MSSVVLLSRRQKLLAAASGWGLSGPELFLFESPSEALARLSLGTTAVFLFDTRDYPRFKHVVRKFLSMNIDADLVLIGQPDTAEDLADLEIPPGAMPLPPDTDPAEIAQVVQRLLRLREVRLNSGIIGRSRAVTEMLSLVAHSAPLDVNVLILGESGTGKELVARSIHRNSPRRGGPFIGLNCGAMTEGVLESELFGHARGAFTGAVQDHPGVFKRADKGTLFLDEVAELPLGMQTRFLRALETGEFTPVGGRAVQRSDIRLVAATHRDLAAAVNAGRFRQDLYYRLRVVVINTPPLRERRQDIPVLAEVFLQQENQRHGLHVRGLSRAAQQALLDYPWPGNVRELLNTVSSAVVLKQRGLIEREDLPPEVLQSAPGGTPASYLPVALGPASGPELDLGVLAGTLLELRQDVREIKALLRRERQGPVDGKHWDVGPDGRLAPFGGGVVETYSTASDYSPLAAEQVGDLQTAERTLVEAALQASGGNRRKAARRLGISERTLYRKLKHYGFS